MDDRSKRLQDLINNRQQKKKEVQKKKIKKNKVSDIFLELEQERRTKLVEVWEGILEVLLDTDDSIPHVLSSFLTAYDDMDFKTLKFENKERRLEFIEFQLSKWIKSNQQIPVDLLAAYSVFAKSQTISQTKGLRLLQKHLHSREVEQETLKKKIEKLRLRSRELTNIITREDKRLEAKIHRLDEQFSYFARWKTEYKDKMAAINVEKDKLTANEKAELTKVENELTSLETEIIFAEERLKKARSDISQIDAGTDRYDMWFLPLGLEPHYDITIEMKKVSKGKHWRGSYENPEERPIANIRLSYSFEIMATPVTQGLFIAVMGKNTSTNRGLLKPVERVSWFDAIQFCNALSVIFGLDEAYKINQTTGNVRWVATSNGFRLPTEFEWEAAARSGQSTDFAGSENPDKVSWSVSNAKNKTKNVRRKNPNAFGLYDMSGNVWEWCWDFYDPNYYQNSPKEDPKGPKEGTKRSMRGGSVSSKSDRSRVAARSGAPPSAIDSFLGFRVVRTITD